MNLIIHIKLYLLNSKYINSIERWRTQIEYEVMSTCASQCHSEQFLS